MLDLEDGSGQSFVLLRQSCQRGHQSFKFRVQSEVYRLKAVLKDTFLIWNLLILEPRCLSLSISLVYIVLFMADSLVEGRFHDGLLYFLERVLKVSMD